MKDSIKLSKEHGVNPSLDVCFWCGEPKGIILAGELPNDVEAPHELVTGYDPCDDCQTRFNEGVHIVEAVPTQLHEGQMPISENNGNPLYPTRRWLVMTRDSDFIKNNNIKDPVIIIDEELMNAFLQDVEKDNDTSK